MKPLIGIPVIDRPKTTERCLKAMFTTEDRNSYTLAIIDNASNDETQEMLKTYEKDFDYLIKNDWNVGVVFAYNQFMALREKTQPCMIINADVWVQSHNWLKSMMEVLDDPRVGVVAGRRPEFWIDTQERFQFYGSGLVCPVEIRGHWCEIVRTGQVIMPFTMIRGEAVDKVGFMNESTGIDDSDYNPRVAITGWYTVYCTDLIFYQPQDEVQTHPGYAANRLLVTKSWDKFKADMEHYHQTRDVYRGTRFLPETMTDPGYTAISNENWEFFKEYVK